MIKQIRNDHRWTDAEMRQFIGMWIGGDSIEKIAETFGVSRHGVNKFAGRCRREGIPLPRRKAGHVAERRNCPWTQEEVEFLIRRRSDGANADKIGEELGRSYLAVQGMVRKLIAEGVPMPMMGSGVRRLWSADKARIAIAGRGVVSESDKTNVVHLRAA